MELRMIQLPSTQLLLQELDANPEHQALDASQVPSRPRQSISLLEHT